MRKTFALVIEGRNRDRVLEAVKHEIRKYLKRERRRDVPAGGDYWDFDCKFGLTAPSAQPVHPGNLIGSIDAAAKEGAEQVYIEILARPGQRKRRPGSEAGLACDHANDESS